METWVLGNKAAERVWVHPTTVAAEDDNAVREPAAVAGSLAYGTSGIGRRLAYSSFGSLLTCTACVT